MESYLPWCDLLYRILEELVDFLLQRLALVFVLGKRCGDHPGVSWWGFLSPVPSVG